MTSAS